MTRQKRPSNAWRSNTFESSVNEKTWQKMRLPRDGDSIISCILAFPHNALRQWYTSLSASEQKTKFFHVVRNSPGKCFRGTQYCFRWMGFYSKRRPVTREHVPQSSGELTHLPRFTNSLYSTSSSPGRKPINTLCIRFTMWLHRLLVTIVFDGEIIICQLLARKDKEGSMQEKKLRESIVACGTDHVSVTYVPQ